MIVAAAIKLIDGSVYVGERHNDCFRHLKEINERAGDDAEAIRKLNLDSEQGFINDKLVFLTREQAYYEAYKCNQCKKQEFKDMGIKGLSITKENWKPCLFSEDLW